jgi:glycosyltransferase involved in cell wall biosynthesis
VQSPPLISVVIAVKNCASTLPACLESILSQTYRKYEILVVDGGSTDGTVGVLAKFKSHLSFCRSEPDRGIPDAWNKGLAQAKGEWVQFLGADDLLASADAFERCAQALTVLGDEVLLAVSPTELITEQGDVVPGFFSTKWTRADYLGMWMRFSHQGVFHRRSLFERYGTFDVTFKLVPDYELLLRYLKDNDPVILQTAPVARMRMGGISWQPDKAFSMARECGRARHKHGVGPSALSARVYGKAMIRTMLATLLGRRSASLIIGSIKSWTHWMHSQ